MSLWSAEEIRSLFDKIAARQSWRADCEFKQSLLMNNSAPGGDESLAEADGAPLRSGYDSDLISIYWADCLTGWLLSHPRLFVWWGCPGGGVSRGGCDDGKESRLLESPLSPVRGWTRTRREEEIKFLCLTVCVQLYLWPDRPPNSSSCWRPMSLYCCELRRMILPASAFKSSC